MARGGRIMMAGWLAGWLAAWRAAPASQPAAATRTVHGTLYWAVLPDYLRGLLATS